MNKNDNNTKLTTEKGNLDKKLAKIRRYNEEHGTHLTYGQYSTLERFGRL